MADIRKQASGIQRGSSTLAKAIAPIMLDKTLDWWRRDMMVHLHKIRDLCDKRMNAMPGVTFPHLEGTNVPFPRFDVGLKSKDLVGLLQNEGRVGTSAGTGFGAKGENHLRMCIATSEAIMNDALNRIEKTLEKLTKTK
jgi:aspartate/methionine/tyrosine aminotransferase